MQQNEHERFLKPRQAAELIGTTEGVLAQYRCRNIGLKFYRWGKSIRYRESDIIEFMEKTAVVPVGE